MTLTGFIQVVRAFFDMLMVPCEPSSLVADVLFIKSGAERPLFVQMSRNPIGGFGSDWIVTFCLAPQFVWLSAAFFFLAWKWFAIAQLVHGRFLPPPFVFGTYPQGNT